ncbi:adenosylcobinamide kinase/adenosylcobinamide phosphate guanyltransferase [Desulfomarina profundi]|uniref:Adenosylcobinamide kinase/adenosylcobinamide phosphate guanyltransferase n=1 Tax=Desulfomarina profundi TaxID=2772557 RepID=A0A8D5FKS6_9BACT|nr:bifunctional adenosylcobinamide kinase/adenosylcobinamide-phosphate guanylyltransferase [Desulfomarina profundi]BCL60833.1 adenosylcobinamide kinase/adenosylcobinamide phosphate guanyltransferase [Desulfomarina profundi]
MAELILITGGARSGKSSYALEVSEKKSHSRIFIATCPSIDQEMSDRVTRHREERQGRGWQTIEEEIELAALFPEKVQDAGVVLIDCVTLWVNNILYNYGEEKVDDFVIKNLCLKWLLAMENFPGTVICVTNEVGLGVVPENRLARKYRDLVGTCNQLIGRKADEVVLVSCGVPLKIKKKRS